MDGRLLAAAARVRTVVAAGHETAYHEAGTGRPVVLLHGSGPGVSAWSNWAGALPALAASGHRVLAPDIAGFGGTRALDGAAYGIKLWVRHLFEFLDAVDVPSALLVGNSFGGGLALAATLRDASRVDGLVLLGTPAGTFTMTEGLRAGWHYEPDLDEMRRILRLFPYDQSLVTDEMVKARYEASARPGAQDAFRKLIPEPGPADTQVKGVPEDRLRTIEKPALVVHGREDRVIPVELGWRLARAIPDAELHVFGNCGHWVQLERPDAFTSLVSDFARRLP
ncbi:alpha/beta fold hydrolase [Actinomadura chibensis]|uniref:Alpha/beta fold hydrolase n=1 Tax=Actinomadura chibensis TaxID=392828 RepID=A0A5D0NZU0_9ACTN|nr:alpha/beta hydrolase [Actinomadura chibensis]TYB49688.1 alpha/beta fold hydrolase [Actinomadura chibensis]